MIQPRIIRLKDAPGYLGMDKNKFNELVRPFVREIRYGLQSVAFDRLDLDAWIDDYISRNGRPGKQKGGKPPWRERSQGSLSAARYGTSRNASEEEEFGKAVEQAISRKQNNT